MIFQGHDYRRLYKDLLAELLDDGVEEKNERTGARIKVIRGGVAFNIEPHGFIPVCGVRKLRPKTAASEVAWFLSGSKDVKDLEDLGCKIWSKFQDGKGQIEGAYGYRWRRHFGRDQLGLALQALRKDPSDRQVLVTAWDPADDGLGVKKKSNVSCPTHFTLSILGGELHSSLFLRSSDVFVGLGYDLMGHALLCDALANSLHVDLGVLTFTLAHAHIYDSHYEMAEEALKTPQVKTEVRLPGFTCGAIELNPERYVKVVGEAADAAVWPDYDPKPMLVL